MCEEHQMIDPFVPHQVREGNISYGLSSFGYDIRVADEFRIFSPATGQLHLVDPKNFSEDFLVDYRGPHCDIPPNSFVLARSVERFQMPPNVMALCVGKSSLARCGIIVNVTPLEPSWTGYLTIEISNTAPLPARIYAHEGIAQLLFLEGEEPLVTYAHRAGKYQDQKGIVVPRV